MLKRIFDTVISGLVLLAVWPVILLAALITKIVSPGPPFYLAQRVGKDGTVFKMYKLRSMHLSASQGTAITAPQDTRIFPFGRFVRKSKIDELPQFWNVFIGDMSIVGPRPEDPQIVADHYAGWMSETLETRPGITSPGAVFGYLEGDEYLAGEDVERAYAKNLLPKKLKIELDYLRNASFLKDIGVIIQTARAIAVTALQR